MSRVIAIANTKGGVGKSTLTINLAVEASRAGKKVLIVDADPQSTAVQFLSVRDKLPEIQGVQITKPILHRQMPTLAAAYDLALIDVGGRDAPVFRSALVAATTIVVPMVPSAPDTWASGDVFGVVDELSATRDDLETVVVLNMVTRVGRRGGGTVNTVVVREAVSQLEEYLSERSARLLQNQITFRTAWQRSVGEGLGVSEWEPAGTAAKELAALCRELGVAHEETSQDRAQPV